jgi:dTDP-4-dehydrorhamnose reductase
MTSNPPEPRPLRLLVSGGTGLLGAAVLAEARRDPGFALSATYHRAAPPPEDSVTWLPLELRAVGSAEALMGNARPDVVLHCAVAIAPADLGPVIVRGSADIARAAHALGAPLVHVSSDMVFDGASGPYAEHSPVSPITDYGRAKARAEEAVRREHPASTIVRTSLLYRLTPPDRSLGAWLDGLARGAAYPLFVDEIRCPASVLDVARALLELARRRARAEALPGVLHAVGPEPISRHAFGVLVLRALGKDPALAASARSADSGMTRPRELVLTTRATPSWMTAGIGSPGLRLGVMTDQAVEPGVVRRHRPGP